jgi:peptide-methionine (S)-S-oxide reductase
MLAAAMLAMVAGPSSPIAARPQAAHLQHATFAAGCFWGVEAAFRKVPGVVSTVAGYTGGDSPNPTYRDVALGRSRHCEAVLVTYDPSRVSYARLLDAFWSCHDPTADLSLDNAPGPHRSAIFFHDPQQESIARTSLKEVVESHVFDGPIVTQIVPVQTFYPAEQIHQNYLERNGIPGSCHIGSKTVHTLLIARSGSTPSPRPGESGMRYPELEADIH